MCPEAASTLQLLAPYDQKYVVIREIDSGSQARIFEAVREDTAERVALKVLRPSPGSAKTQQNRKQRLLQEAKLLRAIRHPHVVAAYDDLPARLGEHETWVVVLELLRGSLRDLMIKNPSGLPVDFGCELLYQTLSGLVRIHQHNVAVCDLRPDNLLLSQDGAIKIADLGMARMEDYSPTIQEGSRYLAPEVLDGRIHAEAGCGSLLERYRIADIYSVAFMFYEALVGVDKWERIPALESVYGSAGVGSNLPTDRRWEAWHRDPMKQLPPIREVNPTVPVGLEKVIERMLQKDPAKRFRDAGEALSALTEIGGIRPHAYDEDLFAPAVKERPSRAPRAVTARPHPQARMKYVYYVLGLVALAVVVWQLMSRGMPHRAILNVVPSERTHMTVTWGGKHVLQGDDDGSYALPLGGSSSLQISVAGSVVLDTTLALSDNDQITLDVRDPIARLDWSVARQVILGLYDVGPYDTEDIEVVALESGGSPLGSRPAPLRINQDRMVYWVLATGFDRLLMIEYYDDTEEFAIIFPNHLCSGNEISVTSWTRVPPAMGGSPGMYFEVIGPAGEQAGVAIGYRSGSPLDSLVARYPDLCGTDISSDRTLRVESPFRVYSSRNADEARDFASDLSARLGADRSWRKSVYSYVTVE